MPSILGNGLDVAAIASSTAATFTGDFSSPLILLVAGSVALLCLGIVAKILHKK